MPLQLRRGLDADRATTTFAEGEPLWTTDTSKLYIGDGVTPGGVEITGSGGGNTFTNITVTGTATVGVLEFSSDAYITKGNNYDDVVITSNTASVRVNAPQGLIIGDDGAGPAVSEIDVNQITGLAGGPVNIPTTATILSLIIGTDPAITSRSQLIGATGATGPAGADGATGATGPSGSPFGGGTFTGTVTFKGVNETVYDSGSVAAGTYTPDVSSGTVHKMLLTGNVTINALANATTGSNATLILTQDATGARLLSSTMKFAAGNKTLSTAATSTDIISVFYDGSTYWASLTRGFI